MTGMARYATVIPGVYVVAGKLSQKLPLSVQAGLVAVASFLLAAYAAHFAQWYWVS